jgi:hypothetical protein
MARDDALKKWPPAIKEEIQEAIVKGARGM